MRVDIFSLSNKKMWFNWMQYLELLSDLPLWFWLIFWIKSKSSPVILKDWRKKNQTSRAAFRSKYLTDWHQWESNDYVIKCVFIMFACVWSYGLGAHKELICLKLINLYINVDAGKMRENSWVSSKEEMLLLDIMLPILLTHDERLSHMRDCKKTFYM